MLPFKYLGVPKETLIKLDGVLKPYVDAGYSRNDDPLTAPITVDPINGYDPAAVTAPATQAAFGGAADPVSQLLAGLQYVLNNPAEAVTAATGSRTPRRAARSRSRPTARRPRGGLATEASHTVQTALRGSGPGPPDRTAAGSRRT